MLKILYIGQYTEGTTSKMRADALAQILKPNRFQVIDTHIPFYNCHPFWRSLAFRYKRGKLIDQTTEFILNKVNGSYDAIWIDKGVFIQPKVVKKLKSLTNKLIHYTPDTAFLENQSRFFNQSLKHYDFVITTKSFEEENYLEYIRKDQLLIIPQGFNKELHYPRNTFSEKSNEVVFIGLFEPSRGKIIESLLKNNISVAVAGKKWNAFNQKFGNHKNFRFIGDGLFGEEYAKTISEASFSLGLLSKRFPELHTTRTFEIPACGTALLTEQNKETASFYKADDVIFFKDMPNLISKIKYFLSHPDKLKEVTDKGFDKVQKSGFDYQSQLKEVCNNIGLIHPHN
jgi:spore maturation protein CgeB